MENDSYVIDSSVLVALYREIDEQHADAVRVMKEIEQSTLLLHPYVIQETATVLTYRCSVRIGQQFLKDVQSADNVELQPVVIQRDIDGFIKNSAKVSFTDVALLSLARITGAQLVTFDEQLRALAKR